MKTNYIQDFFQGIGILCMTTPGYIGIPALFVHRPDIQYGGSERLGESK
jgi:hypothetical protein